MGQSKPPCEEDAPPERPRCLSCGMRMITVTAPPPERHECLRCSYSEIKDT
jgi:hypothetical protein